MSNVEKFFLFTIYILYYIIIIIHIQRKKNDIIDTNADNQ